MTDTTTAPMTQSERRDMFAAAALTGMGTWWPVDQRGYALSSPEQRNAAKAELAFALADAMIAASKEKDGE